MIIKYLDANLVLKNHCKIFLIKTIRVYFMLNKIIQFSIKNKLIIGVMTLALIIWGLWSASKLPVDALPDVTNNQVQVITRARLSEVHVGATFFARCGFSLTQTLNPKCVLTGVVEAVNLNPKP